MRLLRSRYVQTLAVLCLACILISTGVCQAGATRTVTFAVGNIFGHITTTSHFSAQAISIELLPSDSKGHAYNALSRKDGSFSFRLVNFGTYYLIVPMHPETRRLITLDRPNLDVKIHIASREPLNLHESSSLESMQTLPKGKLSFSISGAHGTTAPSGYSAGVSAESTSDSMQHLTHLAAKTTLFAGTEIPSCDQARQLVHEHIAAPGNFQINFKLGVFYLAHANYSKSIRRLVLAHTAKPSDVACGQDLALAYLSAKRFDDAIALLQRTAENLPSNPTLHLLLADAYRGKGNIPAARAELLQATASGKSANTFFKAGAGLLEIGKPHDALAVFRRGASLYPNSATLFMGLGISQNAEHLSSKALASFLHSVDLDPDYAPPYEFLARMETGNASLDQKIMQRITAFVVTHPGSAGAHYDYALALWEHSRESIQAAQLNEIAGELHLAIRLNAKRSDFYFLLGVIDAERRRLTQAATDFKECLALASTDAEAHYRLSLIYRRLGRPDLANNQLQKFLELRRGQRLSASARIALRSATGTITVNAGTATPCQGL